MCAKTKKEGLIDIIYSKLQPFCGNFSVSAGKPRSSKEQDMSDGTLGEHSSPPQQEFSA
jgi:hypothetical protein